MWHTEDLFLWDIAAHKGVQVDDLSPHGTYYNYAYEQEDQQTNDDVLELGTENEREREREGERGRERICA